LPWVEDSQRSSLCGDSWSCSVIDEEKELLEVVDHGVTRWSEMGSLCQIFREPQDSPTHGLSLHCPCVCAAETRSAHPHSCSFRNRRAKTAAFVSPLLLPIRHVTLPPPPSRRPGSTCIRAVSSVALSSMASDQCIAHQLGRGLSSPNENTATRCTPPPCTSLPCIDLPPSSVVGHALVSALPCLSCALLYSAAHTLLHPRARICHTLADFLCPRFN
jgi:hypothetical protein